MVQFNFSERTIKAKVVYYGPAQSGKTTNLEQIHRLTDPQQANRLISLNTAQDRTLFFDLLPFSLGSVSGYDFKVQLYTVPGQVQYNATRRVVLAGADGVVFVADSRKSNYRENLTAFENMKVNLLANRLVPEKVPLVLQYNKQDLPDLQTEAEMSRGLNPWGRPSFTAVAAQGKGVLETFVAVVQEVLAAIAVKYNLKEKGLDPSAVPEMVAQAFGGLLRQTSQSRPSTPEAPSLGKVVVAQATDSEHSAPLQGGSEAGLVSEELLHRAIRSNVELAEVVAGLVREFNVGLSKIGSGADVLLDDDRDKRVAAAHHIQQEIVRLKKFVEGLGQPQPAEKASAPTRPQPPAPPIRPAPQEAAPSPPPARPSAPAAQDPFSISVRDAVVMAKEALDARGISIEVKIPPGTAPPRCSADKMSRALGLLLQGVSLGAARTSALVLRCERKPVLLRSRDGTESRRDFLMVALAQAGTMALEEQQQTMQGTAAGPLGEAARLVREMGGFLRFAPLAASGLETRVFLPA